MPSTLRATRLVAVLLACLLTVRPSTANAGRPEDELRLKNAGRLLDDGEPTRAIGMLATRPLPEDPELRLRALELRGNALVALDRPRAAATTFREAARTAERHGYVEAEEDFLLGAFSSLVPEFEFLRLEEVVVRLLAVQRELGKAVAAAKTQADLGAVQMELGRTQSGIENLIAAREVLRGRHCTAEVAHVEVSLARALRVRGEYAEALTYAEGAVKSARQHDLGAMLLADALEALGNVYGNLGRHERAIEHYEEAVALLGKVEDPAVAYTIGNIGLSLLELGRLEAGEALFHKACPMLKAFGDDRSAANCHLHLGQADLQRENAAEALAHLDTAARLAQGDLWTSTHIARYRGDARILAGETQAAETAYEEALKGARFMECATLQVEALRGIAEARLLEDDAHAAVVVVREAFTIMQRTTSGLGDDLGAEARAHGDHARLIETALRAAFRHGAPAVVAEFLERTRAGAFLEAIGGREALRGAGVPSELAQEEADAKVRLAAVTLRHRTARAGGVLEEIRACRVELLAARRTYQDVADRMQRVAKRGAHVTYPKCAGLVALQDGLDEDRALALYAVLPKRAYALVVTSEDARVVELGDTAAIREACENLRSATTGHGSERTAVARVGRLLLDPLVLPDTVRLIVSPDGLLASLPWPMVAGQRDVACVPSGTTYHLLRSMRVRGGEHLLALGDPEYGVAHSAQRLRGADEGTALPRLPGTGEEARAIARRSDTLLLGPGATEAALRKALATPTTWCSVHLACHGLLNEDAPSCSALALTPSGDDDGLLTALEVLRMRVPADLVVLSACETGRGRFLQGEGLMGLARAFLVAGAPRVLVSLWPVDDEATRALMECFYEIWREGTSTAEALRRAQAHVREKPRWKHSRYWAAWVLWGLPD